AGRPSPPDHLFRPLHRARTRISLSTWLERAPTAPSAPNLPEPGRLPAPPLRAPHRGPANGRATAPCPAPGGSPAYLPPSPARPPPGAASSLRDSTRPTARDTFPAAVAALHRGTAANRPGGRRRPDRSRTRRVGFRQGNGRSCD